MAAKKQDFTVKHGDTLNVQIPILHSDGTPVNLATPVGIWKVYELDFCIDGEEPAVELSGSNEGVLVQQATINGVTTWAMTIQIRQATLADLAAGGHYHEAIVTDGDSVTRTIAIGVVTILPSLGSQS